MRQKLTIFAIISILITLTSCDHAVKRYLGIDRKSPDEYSVVRTPPLSIPPNFELTPPKDSSRNRAEQAPITNSDKDKLTENDKLFLKKTQKPYSKRKVTEIQ